MDIDLSVDKGNTTEVFVLQLPDVDLHTQSATREHNSTTIIIFMISNNNFVYILQNMLSCYICMSLLSLFQSRILFRNICKYGLPVCDKASPVSFMSVIFHANLSSQSSVGQIITISAGSLINCCLLQSSIKTLSKYAKKGTFTEKSFILQ